MPRFFVQQNAISDNTINITNDNFRHLKNALRAKENDDITICDGCNNDYFCRISEVREDCIIANIIEKSVSKSESNFNITLLMAMPKGEKSEFIIEKCVELGVYNIVFFVSKFCVSRPDEKKIIKKLERFNLISESAAKQSGRGIIPKITFESNIKNAVGKINSNCNKILFYEGEAKYIKSVLQESIHKDYTIAIGSEGGFDTDEVDLFIQNGFCIASLGNRILRCETAPISAISIILYEKENNM